MKCENDGRDCPNAREEKWDGASFGVTIDKDGLRASDWLAKVAFVYFLPTATSHAGQATTQSPRVGDPPAITGCGRAISTDFTTTYKDHLLTEKRGRL